MACAFMKHLESVLDDYGDNLREGRPPPFRSIIVMRRPVRSTMGLAGAEDGDKDVEGGAADVEARAFPTELGRLLAQARLGKFEEALLEMASTMWRRRTQPPTQTYTN